MVKTSSSLLLLFLCASSGRAAEPTLRTSLQLVACPASGHSLEVFSKNGKQLTELKSQTQVNRFQGWGENDITVGALKLSRVQIPSRPELSDVYVDALKLSSSESCAKTLHLKIPTPPLTTPLEDDDDEEDDDSAAPIIKAAAPHEVVALSLDSKACCSFPLKTRPLSFLSGIARFGAGRRRRRIHAGADLYGARGQAVFSVAPGVVVRAPYVFKSGTLAIDVRHKGGFVVRYGEISGKSFGLHMGSELKAGQQVGEMRYVPGAPSAMTHFELYRGTATGKLSQPGHNKYSRRGDLINPTPYLVKWEKKK